MAEFDRYAENYKELLRSPMRDSFGPDGFFHRRKWILLEDWFKLHPLPANPAWLDIGCGQGELLSLGRHRFTRVEGCDPAAEMMRNTAHPVRLQTDPRKLPYGDAEFDFLTAVCIYHHVEEADRLPLTQEVHRVLKPGGTACIIEHNPYNPVTQWVVSRTPVDVDAHLLTPGQAQGYMRSAGLQKAGVENFLFIPEFLYPKVGGIEDLLGWLPLGGQYAALARKPV